MTEEDRYVRSDYMKYYTDLMKVVWKDAGSSPNGQCSTWEAWDNFTMKVTCEPSLKREVRAG